MKINSCLLIAIATAITLTSSFTNAKRDRRDAIDEIAVVAAAPEAFENANDPSDLWNHKHRHNGKHHGNHYGKHYGKHHGKHHGKHPHKRCKTQTVVYYAPCTIEANGGGGRGRGNNFIPHTNPWDGRHPVMGEPEQDRQSGMGEPEQDRQPATGESEQDRQPATGESEQDRQPATGESEQD
ncbi:hypothetical protein BG006_000417, partial [Podila minutissima]